MSLGLFNSSINALPSPQRPQPTNTERKSTDGPRYLRASEMITLPPLQKRKAAHAETSFIAPELNVGYSMLHRLDVLGESLLPRAGNPKQFKVVAVDGTNRNAVHLVIASLHYQITKDLQYIVRVVGENFQGGSANPPTAFSKYVDRVRDWGLMWEMMHQTRIPERRPEHSARPTTHATTSYPYPLVYILPLSPLMATLEASKSTEVAQWPPDDIWRWLAGRWAGYLRPDVTVVLQESHDNQMDQSVLRVGGPKMRTLIVTNGRDGQIDLTPAQLRRITFEVNEWLYTG